MSTTSMRSNNYVNSRLRSPDTNFGNYKKLSLKKILKNKRKVKSVIKSRDKYDASSFVVVSMINK